MSLSKGMNLDELNDRLKSFRTWKANVSVIELAVAGLAYTGTDDTVWCKECDVRISSWATFQNPFQVHRKLSPGCQYLKKSGFIVNFTLARSVRYAQYATRLQSMSEVPPQFIPCLPPVDTIARAGFFYLGTLDRMCCYHCGLILRDWESSTDPTSVHLEYASNCYFITTYHNLSSSDKEINNTVLSSENFQAIKQNRESLTGRIGTMLNTVNRVSNATSDKRPTNSTNCNNIPQTTCSASHAKANSNVNNGKPLEICDNKKFIVEVHHDNYNSNRKASQNFSNLTSTSLNKTTSNPSMLQCDNDSGDEYRRNIIKTNKGENSSLQLSSESSGYHTFNSAIENNSPLPPIPNNDNHLLQLPIVKAVMEFEGVSFESVAEAFHQRLQNGGDEFTCIDDLLYSIIKNKK